MASVPEYDEFSRYRNELAEALGKRQAIPAIREALDVIGSLIAGSTLEQLERASPPGSWSARDVLAHLADVELVWGLRVRMILTEDRPILVPMDQEAWVDRFASLEPDPLRIFETFRVLRRANLRIYESISGAEAKRTGIHGGWGELSIQTILEMQGGHGLMHARQMREAMGA